MPTPLIKRICQLPSLSTPATQLAGAYLAWDVPLGPVNGGYKTYRGTPEELVAYLSAQGLLSAYNARPSLRKAVEYRTIAEKTANPGSLPDSSTMEELDPASLCLGTEIYVVIDPDAHHEYKVVYDINGPLSVWVDGDFAQSPRGRIQARIEPAKSNATEFLPFTYTVQAADLPEPTFTVPDAIAFSPLVGIEGTNGSLVTLTYGVGFTIAGNVVKILTAANAQAGEKVHLHYLPGTVQAPPSPLLAFVGTVSQPQDVKSGAFYYIPNQGLYKRIGADATVTSLDTTNTASWQVLLEQAQEVDVFPSQAKRTDVIGRFTAGVKSIADVPLAGDTRSYFFAEFYDFGAGADYLYKCYPRPDMPDANGQATAWWVKIANN